MALLNVLTSLIKRYITKHFIWLAFIANGNSKSFKERIKEKKGNTVSTCCVGRSCGIKRIDYLEISYVENGKDYFWWQL